MDIPILYEDNHLLIVSKPINMPVQEDRTRDMDVLTALKNDLKIRYQKPGNVYLGLVHRLDRPVGGAIVFAKTSKAASRLSDMMRCHTVKRTYLAIVRGTLGQKKGRLEHYLYKDKRKNKVYVVASKHPGAKKAILEYHVVGEKDGLSMLAVQLHTGRPHQIRVQLSTIGHPIYGDQKYGQKVNKPGQQIALWSYSVNLKHPVKDTTVAVQAAYPNYYPWNVWTTEEDGI